MRKNKKWFSVILAILMTWFMIILTSGIFLLVLWENKDTKAIENYYKSLEWANWALELAMLKSKKYNYSYDEVLDNSSYISKILFSWSSYLFNKDVKISYDISSISSEIIDKKILNWEFDIIPLFSYDTNGNYKKVNNITITWLNSDVVWNIVWKTSWITWVWNFTSLTNGNHKTISWDDVSYESKTVWTFLLQSDYNYLILHNLSSGDVNYNLKSLNPWEFLTKDKTQIIATWEVWWFKQNIRVSIDSSKYLNLLKYSIFSN